MFSGLERALLLIRLDSKLMDTNPHRWSSLVVSPSPPSSSSLPTCVKQYSAALIGVGVDPTALSKLLSSSVQQGFTSFESSPPIIDVSSTIVSLRCKLHFATTEGTNRGPCDLIGQYHSLFLFFSDSDFPCRISGRLDQAYSLINTAISPSFLFLLCSFLALNLWTMSIWGTNRCLDDQPKKKKSQFRSIIFYNKKSTYPFWREIVRRGDFFCPIGRFCPDGRFSLSDWENLSGWESRQNLPVRLGESGCPGKYFRALREILIILGRN